MILDRPRREPSGPRPLLEVVVWLVAATLLPAWSLASDEKSNDRKRPSLSLKASPSISFSPARIFLVAQLTGGRDDDEALYCASIEWDWGDGTKSESNYDCDPYEAGKSEIRRRFAVEHVYRAAGNYRVQIRLKKGDRTVTAATTSVQVRPGVRDIGH